MANREKTLSPEIHCVFVETSLDTCLTLPVHKDEIISDFKDKLRKEHKQVFPEIGDIYVSALKVKRRRKFYHFSESMNVCKAFDGISRDWFIYVDAVRVEKGEVLTIMATDEKRSNLELVEKKKEIAISSVLLDGHTKDLSLKEGLETVVVEKKTKKRKIKSSDGKTSRKKPKVDLNQSAVSTTELCGKVQGEVASQSCAVSPREKLDDILAGAIGKDIESGEKNGVSTGENQQTSDVDKLLEEKILTVSSELVDGHTRGLVKDVPDNQTVKEALEKLDDLTGAIEQDLEKGGKTADIVMIDQEKDLPPASEFVDGQITSQDDKRDEGIRLAPSAVDDLQTAEMVTYVENQLEASSGLTTGPATEKKRKRMKSSKDHIHQSTVVATTTSRKIVNEITEEPGNVDCVDAISKSCPNSDKEILGNPLVEAVQKEAEMGEKSVEAMGRDYIETDNLASHPENHLEAYSGLTTSPVTEKKKRGKNSKAHINQPAAAAAAAATATATETTGPREIVNEINGLPANVDRVDGTSESYPLLRRGNLGKENEIGEKINEDVGSGKAIPSSTNDLVSYPENQLEVSNNLTTGPAREKKKKQKKSSKDDINKSTTATTTSKTILNEREKVSGSINCVDATSESIPNSRGEKLADTLVDAIQNVNEMGVKFVDKVGSREATLIDADKKQDANNLQVASLASTPTALVHESKSVDHIGKFTDENTSCEHELSKEKVELDADQAKPVKSTKKKSSKKAKTPAKEDTLVDSGAQNVEPIKVVDGEGPETVIRNVLDSLQQRNKAEENLDKSGKKSSKRPKKKDSLNIVEEDQVVDSLQQKNEAAENLEKSGKKSSKRSKRKDSLNIVEEVQVLSVEVNNAAQEEASPINNPKDTEASFTPAKKNTESNASHLNKIIEVADNTEDINRSMQTLKEHASMGDSFGSSQKENIVGGCNKQDQVAGGAKSEKENKRLDLHPGGSIDGAMKPKERKGRVQPSSSDTSQLQSKDKNDRSGSKVDHSDASMKGALNDKKEAVKKSSKLATVNKSKNVNNKNEAVKKSSNSFTVNKSKTNFFKDTEKWNSAEDESKTTSHVSTKTPLDSSSDDDSDVTSSMPRKQGNNLAGGTNKFLGSLQDILRSSKSYKAAKLTASQSQPDEFDGEIPGLDVVPDSQAN